MSSSRVFHLRRLLVYISFSFQKFDSEWGEFVEIDEDDELADREKIKGVVIATLGTPGTSTNEEVIYTYIFTSLT